MVDVGSALTGMGPMIFGFFGQFMYWLGIILMASLILGGMVAVYYYMSFKIKMTVFKLVSDGRGGFAIGKIISNRAKMNRDKNSWSLLFPFGNKKKHKPFDPHYHYTGSRVFACEVNGEIQPVEAVIDNKKLNLVPVSHHIREWQSFQHKKNAEETAKHDFWADNKQFFMVLGTALVCCVLVGATVYFTYKFATTGTNELTNLANAIRNIGSSVGAPTG